MITLTPAIEVPMELKNYSKCMVRFILLQLSSIAHVHVVITLSSWVRCYVEQSM